MKRIMVYLAILLSLLSLNYINAEWETVSPYFGGNTIKVVRCEDNLYALTSAGVYISRNEGKIWEDFNNGMNTTNLRTIEVFQNYIIVAYEAGGAIKLKNGENTWKEINGPGGWIDYIQSANDTLFVAVRFGTIYYTTNFGETWNYTPSLGRNSGFVYINKKLFVISYEQLYMWTFGMSGWKPNSNMTDVKQVLTYENSIVVVCANDVFRSDDYGETWYNVYNTPLSYGVIGYGKINSTWYIMNTRNFYTSTDNGINWRMKDFPPSYTPSLISKGMLCDNGKLYVATSGGILYSSDIGETWEFQNNGISMTKNCFFKIIDNSLIVSTFNQGLDYSLSITTTYGENWIQSPLKSAKKVTVDKDTLYGLVDGLFNYAANLQGVWIPRLNSLNDIRDFIIYGDTIVFACGSGLYRSIDRGYTCTNISSGTSWTDPLYGTVYSFADYICRYDNILFTICAAGLCRSYNNGNTWEIMKDHQPGVMCVHKNKIFHAYWYCYLTYAYYRGNVWSSGINLGVSYYLLKSVGDYLFLSSELGLFISTDNGLTWINISLSLQYEIIRDVEILDDYIFIGTDRAMYRRQLSEIVVRVKDTELLIPSVISLDQNYPNPFNPTTTISFSLPIKSSVTLKIYDALGKEVASLINEELQPGTYQKQWSAGNFASGVYFYRLLAGKFSETKKLILQK
ncbi:MAG: T9SS type A sorting domain-containing protein [bacterium]